MDPELLWLKKTSRHIHSNPPHPPTPLVDLIPGLCSSHCCMLITTHWDSKDSGAAESFSEGHLWLTVSGRPCHPASMANEQTQGFSFRFIIVTKNKFQVLLLVVLGILSSHQPANHPQPTNKPYLPAQAQMHTAKHSRTYTDTPKCAQPLPTHTHSQKIGSAN